MSTIFQKYAAALLPFFILVIGASQTVFAGDSTDWNAIITFAILVLGAVLTYIVPLTESKWQGALKTGIAILTVILSALLPFILPGGFDPTVNVPIIIVAVLNALATEFGVQIRTTPVNSAGTTNDPVSIRSSLDPDPAIAANPPYDEGHGILQ